MCSLSNQQLENIRRLFFFSFFYLFFFSFLNVFLLSFFCLKLELVMSLRVFHVVQCSMLVKTPRDKCTCYNEERAKRDNNGLTEKRVVNYMKLPLYKSHWRINSVVTWWHNEICQTIDHIICVCFDQDWLLVSCFLRCVPGLPVCHWCHLWGGF